MLIKKYGAEWCGPCRKLDPILDEIDSEFSDVEIQRIDVDDLATSEEGVQELRDLGISGIPVMFIYNNDGKQVHRIQGAVSRQEIVESLHG